MFKVNLLIQEDHTHGIKSDYSSVVCKVTTDSNKIRIKQIVRTSMVIIRSCASAIDKFILLSNDLNEWV